MCWYTELCWSLNLVRKTPQIGHIWNFKISSQNEELFSANCCECGEQLHWPWSRGSGVPACGARCLQPQRALSGAASDTTTRHPGTWPGDLHGRPHGPPHGRPRDWNSAIRCSTLKSLSSYGEPFKPRPHLESSLPSRLLGWMPHLSLQLN